MRIPADIKIVAYLFILHGVVSVVKFVVALQRSNIRIDVGILCLFAGFGLLNLRTSWWKFAKIYTILYLLGLPFGLLLLSSRSEISVSVLSIPISSASPQFAICAIVGAWLVCFWEYTVLTSTSSKVLYKPSERKYPE